ncbi:MAG TPA: diguanylate cyclase [Terracidiphilus sp.]
MISIRKYLDRSLDPEPVPEPASPTASAPQPDPPKPRNRRTPSDVLSLCLDAYRSVLSDMGRCGVDACAATGPALETSLLQAVDSLGVTPTPDTLAATSENIRKQLLDWGRCTARHYQQKAGEVKGMLLAMARTAESVGNRDRRCSQQLNAVTTQLRRIATLEDITAMRGAIERSAAELKSSIERMNEEGRATLGEMQTRVATFQAKLEEAEQAASCDTLTRLRSRLCIEGQLEQRVAAGQKFCVAILDINGFKQVNDTYGHVLGDELLKHFATELRSACRSSDVVGRWGGDEFIVLLDCGIDHADPQLERVAKWVCGNYVVEGVAGPVKLDVGASVGLAEFRPPESIAELLDRADNAMYSNKRSPKFTVMAS